MERLSPQVGLETSSCSDHPEQRLRARYSRDKAQVEREVVELQDVAGTRQSADEREGGEGIF